MADSNGPSKADAAGAAQGKSRIGGYDWDAWEKFDVEKECAELDEKDQHAWQEGERAKRERMGRCTHLPTGAFTGRLQELV